MSFSLKLLGGVALVGEQGLVTGQAAQRHRLALLAVLAAAHPRAVSRDKVMAWLWPERDIEPARRLLNQAVHALRRTLGAEAILSAGDELQLNAGLVHCDVVAFEEALAGGAPDRAVALYAGPFLDGFFLDDAPEFERWVDRERDRLATARAKALEGLAEAAERTGDAGEAVPWWKSRAAHDPYDSRVALRLMQALERTGNRAGALQHAMLHLQLLRDELQIEPIPEVRALVERLRRELPPPTPTPKKESVIRPAIQSPAAVTASPTPLDPSPDFLEASPQRRRILWYGAAVLLLTVGIGGAIRLAARSGESAAVATPKVVDQIARAVAQELERRQRGDTAVRLPRDRTRSIAAYELYLRGDDPALVRSDSGARRGLEYFRRAVALDSTYAAAWVGLARLTYRASDRGPAAQAAAKVQAEAALRKALALDDSLPEAHALMGVFRGMDYDWASAEQHFRRALSLQPTSPRTREWFVQFLLMTGRPEEALAEAERALVLNPMSPSTIAELARALAANDRCEEALARLETIKDLDPPLLRIPAIAERCYALQRQWADAIAALQPQAGSDSTGSTLALLGYMRGRAGQREEALSIQARLLDRWRRGLVGAMTLAYVPAALGDRDEAFAWLDRALEDGSLRFAPGKWVDLTDVPFDALSQDPRMDRLRERFGHQKR